MKTTLRCIRATVHRERRSWFVFAGAVAVIVLLGLAARAFH
jgi:hypothetical protein